MSPGAPRVESEHRRRWIPLRVGAFTILVLIGRNMIAAGAMLMFSGCAGQKCEEVRGRGIDMSNVADLSTEAIVSSGWRDELLGKGILEVVSDPCPDPGYRLWVPGKERGLSMTLEGVSEPVLDDLWSQHDPVRQSLWIAVRATFSPLASDYQRKPDRDPSCVANIVRIEGWEVTPKHLFAKSTKQEGK